jgi:integrase
MPEKVATTHTLMERTLVVYRRERSSVWQCRFKVAGIWQRASTKEVDLGKAKEVAKSLMVTAEIRKKENLPVVSRKFKHCAALAVTQMDYEQKVGNGKSIYDTYKRVLEDYIVPVLGRRNINSITLADLADLQKSITTKMGHPPAKSTMLKHNAALNRVFDAAIARNFMTRSEVPDITAVGKTTVRGPSFTLAEVHAIRGNFNSWIARGRNDKSRAVRQLLQDYVQVLLNTGARPGRELLELKWNKINYTIEPTARKTGEVIQEGFEGEAMEEIAEVALNKSVQMRVNGKTGSRTMVGMSETCEALARIARRNYDAQNNILKPFSSQLLATNNDFVFQWKSVDGNGKVTFNKAKGFEKMFTAFLREHGLLVDPITEQNRKLYSLRHTYATLALTHDKVPIHTLAKQMGTSVLMIERHYSDLDAVRAIDQLRGEETMRLIRAGSVVKDEYKSQKLSKNKKSE